MGGDINKLCLNCMQYTLNEQGSCGYCGANANAGAQSPHHLAPYTVLGAKYLVGKVLGEGGFGITYLGWDINLEIKVAIKEYYPLGAVTRNTTIDDNVSALKGNTEQVFQTGRERFVEEARRLAKFYNLPGIVSVKDFFLENGTAYIVMEFVEGANFRDHLEARGGRIQEEEALALFKPLITSLAKVHQTGMIHRDISPDNIMITPEGEIRLIDFGAARDFNDENKSLSVMLKPGYAPEEQYRSRGKQGPYTDIYALCATMYRAIEGEKPPEAMERVLEDTLTGFSAPISNNTASAILKGLAVRQENRFQTLDELYKALYMARETPVAALPAITPKQNKSRPAKEGKAQKPAPVIEKHEQGKSKKANANKKKTGPIIGAIAAVAALVLLFVLLPDGDDAPEALATPTISLNAGNTPAPAAADSAPTPPLTQDGIPNVVGYYFLDAQDYLFDAIDHNTQGVFLHVEYFDDVEKGLVVEQINNSDSEALHDHYGEEYIQAREVVELVVSLGPEHMDTGSVKPVPLAWVSTIGGINEPWIEFITPVDENIKGYEFSVSFDGGANYQAISARAYDRLHPHYTDQERPEQMFSNVLSTLAFAFPEQVEGAELKLRIASIPKDGVSLSPAVYDILGSVFIEFTDTVQYTGYKKVEWSDYEADALWDVGLGGYFSTISQSEEREHINLYCLQGNFKKNGMYAIAYFRDHLYIHSCVTDGELLFATSQNWEMLEEMEAVMPLVIGQFHDSERDGNHVYATMSRAAFTSDPNEAGMEPMLSDSLVSASVASGEAQQNEDARLQMISFIGNSVADSTKTRKDITGLALQFQGRVTRIKLNDITDVVLYKDGVPVPFTLPQEIAPIGEEHENQIDPHFAIDFNLTEPGTYELTLKYKGEEFSTHEETIVAQ
ncbi:serine/threonine protein kinase [Christensenellaceae bacterium OttesenSCG-928-M15]|nr:serine/threonine protein kinase [Christensenellaceae bacterium OttesenSCG-928-M15]